jgi:hypothetical protein
VLTKLRTRSIFTWTIRALHAQLAQTVPGHHDVVIVPCWRRPEMLWHCLDNLTRAEGIDQVHVVFRPDSGASAENIDVVRMYSDRLPSFSFEIPPPSPYRRSKQSANLLLGYLSALARARRFVYLIEDDIMVARDFLRWSSAVHMASASPLFCSVGVRNHNRPAFVGDDPSCYYVSAADFNPWALCFRREVLLDLVAPHVNVRYFARPKQYIRRHFPNSRVEVAYCEQDGLLRRIQEAQPSGTLPIAYPLRPRAFHAGFYGYHRASSAAPTGTLSQRIDRLGKIIYDSENMAELTRGKGAPIPDDSSPVDLSSVVWGQPRMVAPPW